MSIAAVYVITGFSLWCVEFHQSLTNKIGSGATPILMVEFNMLETLF